MHCKILNETRGRIRVHVVKGRLTMREADILDYYMRSQKGVTRVSVSDRTGDATIHYVSDRQIVIRALAELSFQDEKAAALVPDQTTRELNHQYQEKLLDAVVRRVLNRLLLPAPVKTALAVVRSLPYLKAGVSSLLHRRVDVAVLDAAAIGVSLLRRDTPTASSIMFMQSIGGIMEDWARKKSVGDLAGMMALNVEKVWKRTPDGQDVLTDVSEIRKDDQFVVRTSGMIPLDGVVTEGNASVNQASMTGESLPVHKSPGSYVYAGTVVEDGNIVIRADKISGSGRYDRIVRMIEESEEMKSETEARTSHLADRLVPYTFLATALVGLLTRNVQKTLSVLMVDYSCALKLSMPIAVLSGMRDCSVSDISVKGGKYMEAVSLADTIVFDKTGTLTHASPSVHSIVTFGGNDEAESLRLAACLEEHYPHSIANAVVQEARKRNLHHEERHTKVEYVVAHGITSTVDGERVSIGSRHFIFEDEKTAVPDGEQEKFDSLPVQYSLLYMARGGVLSAVLCIEDPIREEAADVLNQLHENGIRRVIMMTGDNEYTARSIAGQVGVDEYHSEVLPEDKAELIKKEREAGHTVIMVGDGVNDAPALSEADVGIAISSGAAIAREISDVTIAGNTLYDLVTLKKVSDALMNRIHSNFRGIIGFNTMLIILGVLGIIQPTTSAFLHNASTLTIGLRSMRPLIPSEDLQE
ncbi:MAG: heavy metal translocating P-type ATPase [Clostridiales bacterium]|nr:heavy metal translocating P-type ATPase [Clostridiales bacterium]